MSWGVLNSSGHLKHLILDSAGLPERQEVKLEYLYILLEVLKFCGFYTEKHAEIFSSLGLAERNDSEFPSLKSS